MNFWQSDDELSLDDLKNLPQPRTPPVMVQRFETHSDTNIFTLRIIDTQLNTQEPTPITYNMVCVRENNYGRVNVCVRGFLHDIFMDVGNECDNEPEEDFVANLKFRIPFIFDAKIVPRKTIFKYQTGTKNVWQITINTTKVRKVVNDIVTYLGEARNFYNVSLDDTNLATKLLLHNYMHVRYNGNELPGKLIIHVDDIIVPSSEEEEMSFVGKFPYRVLSLDIECLSGKDGSFPKATRDECEVICIGCSMIDFDGPNVKKEPYNIIFSTCKNIGDFGQRTFQRDGSHMNEFVSVCSSNEQQMLIDFFDFLAEHKPTVLTGYNVKNFDLGYIYDRMDRHKLLSHTAYSNALNRPWGSKTAMFTTNQNGARETRNFKVMGFIIIDIYEFVIGTYKLASYKLDNVAKHFLKDKTKIEFPYSDIGPYYNEGTEAMQLKLLEYCVVDAQLCIELFSHLSIFNNVESLAIVTGVPIRYVLERGQQVRITTLIQRELIIRKSDQFIFPLLNLEEYLYFNSCTDLSKGRGDTKYTGAHVVDPKANYYTTPVCTLDFASLYPSIMSGFNMCYSTLVDEHSLTELDVLTDDKCSQFIQKHVSIEKPGCVKPFLEKSISVFRKELGRNVMVTQTPYMYKKVAFVKSHEQRGVLPGILDYLLGKRKRVRKTMGELEDKTPAQLECTDDQYRLKMQVLNCMQLALKLTANSIYGSTGAVTSKLPCIDIASSVTAHGRFNLDIITIATERYAWSKKADDGLELTNNNESVVVYGDTDSIMIKPGGNLINVERALLYGMEMADLCTALIATPPIKLEFEKVYMPYLLLRKKNYVGLMWTNAKKYKKIDAKGIKTARRDTIPMAKTLLDEIIDMLMFKSSLNMVNVEANIIEYLKKNMLMLKPSGHVSKMPMPTLEQLNSLIISKKYTKENYAGPQPHVNIAKRAIDNPQLRPYAVGDRIPFVVLINRKNTTSSRISDRAYSIEEFQLDPENFFIDMEYYSKAVFLSPLVSIPIYPTDELNARWFEKVANVMHEHFPQINFLRMLPPKYKKFIDTGSSSSLKRRATAEPNSSSKVARLSGDTQTKLNFPVITRRDSSNAAVDVDMEECSNKDVDMGEGDVGVIDESACQLVVRKDGDSFMNTKENDEDEYCPPKTNWNVRLRVVHGSKGSYSLPKSSDSNSVFDADGDNAIANINLDGVSLQDNVFDVDGDNVIANINLDGACDNIFNEDGDCEIASARDSVCDIANAVDSVCGVVDGVCQKDADSVCGKVVDGVCQKDADSVCDIDVDIVCNEIVSEIEKENVFDKQAGVPPLTFFSNNNDIINVDVEDRDFKSPKKRIAMAGAICELYPQPLTAKPISRKRKPPQLDENGQVIKPKRASRKKEPELDENGQVIKPKRASRKKEPELDENGQVIKPKRASRKKEPELDENGQVIKPKRASRKKEPELDENGQAIKPKRASRKKEPELDENGQVIKPKRASRKKEPELDENGQVIKPKRASRKKEPELDENGQVIKPKRASRKKEPELDENGQVIKPKRAPRKKEPELDENGQVIKPKRASRKKEPELDENGQVIKPKRAPRKKEPELDENGQVIKPKRAPRKKEPELDENGQVIKPKRAPRQKRLVARNSAGLVIKKSELTSTSTSTFTTATITQVKDQSIFTHNQLTTKPSTSPSSHTAIVNDVLFSFPSPYHLLSDIHAEDLLIDDGESSNEEHDNHDNHDNNSEDITFDDYTDNIYEPDFEDASFYEQLRLADAIRSGELSNDDDDTEQELLETSLPVNQEAVRPVTPAPVNQKAVCPVTPAPVNQKAVCPITQSHEASNTSISDDKDSQKLSHISESNRGKVPTIYKGESIQVSEDPNNSDGKTDIITEGENKSVLTERNIIDGNTAISDDLENENHNQTPSIYGGGKQHTGEDPYDKTAIHVKEGITKHEEEQSKEEKLNAISDDLENENHNQTPSIYGGGKQQAEEDPYDKTAIHTKEEITKHEEEQSKEKKLNAISDDLENENHNQTPSIYGGGKQQAEEDPYDKTAIHTKEEITKHEEEQTKEDKLNKDPKEEEHNEDPKEEEHKDEELNDESNAEKMKIQDEKAKNIPVEEDEKLKNQSIQEDTKTATIFADDDQQPKLDAQQEDIKTTTIPADDEQQRILDAQQEDIKTTTIPADDEQQRILDAQQEDTKTTTICAEKQPKCAPSVSELVKHTSFLVDNLNENDAQKCDHVCYNATENDDVITQEKLQHQP